MIPVRLLVDLPPGSAVRVEAVRVEGMRVEGMRVEGDAASGTPLAVFDADGELYSSVPASSPAQVAP